jgi:rRNA-processing protein FCF1
MVICIVCNKNETKRQPCVHCKKKQKIKIIRQIQKKKNNIIHSSKTIILDECLRNKPLIKNIRNNGFACYSLKPGTKDDVIRTRVLSNKNYTLVTADKPLHYSMPVGKSILLELGAQKIS